MYTLYSKNGSCSMAVHVLLNELRQAVQLEPYQIDDQINPKLKAINPSGNVPVIQKGDFHMHEGGAILTWLCDTHGGDLLPKESKARANALQWLMFANATLHPAYGRIFFLRASAKDEKEALVDTAVEKIQALWDQIEAQLEGQDYICGEQMGVADILITVIGNWAGSLGIDIHNGPNTKALFRRVSSRPAFQQALDSEQIEYKAAA